MNTDPQRDELLRQPSEPVVDEEALTVGSALRAMREARGVSLAAVSLRIKYSPVQLSRLEAGEWARLPGGVPLRGLVRNYARFLEADVDALLRLLDDEVGSTQAHPTVTHLGARHLAAPQPDLPARGEPAHRTWAWLILLLLIIVGLGWYAIVRGWIPEQWLVFDWLEALRP